MFREHLVFITWLECYCVRWNGIERYDRWQTSVSFLCSENSRFDSEIKKKSWLSLSFWLGKFSSIMFLLMVFQQLLRVPFVSVGFLKRRSHRNPNSGTLGRSFWTAPASHHWNGGNEFMVSTDLDADCSLIWSSARRSSPHFPWKSGLKLLEGKKELRGEMNELRQVSL